LYSYAEWQDKNTVAQLLPGTAHHDSLKQRLDVLADFFRSLTDSEGNPIPIIFRPWHEHNGDWFWWGKTKCTPEEYVQLWRFTVEYLTKEQNIHQLLYAISPDRSRMDSNSLDTDYFYAYPGDAFVDILGLDNYWDMGHGYNQTPIIEQQLNFQKSLEFLSVTARQKHKLAALTETGNEAIRENNWFTQRLLKGLTSSELTKEIVYSLVWRNATKADGKKDHYYTPHKGHPAEKDFIDFYSNSFILFTDKK
jgi:mannan endo-1,4-beta-mannosidase